MRCAAGGGAHAAASVAVPGCQRLRLCCWGPAAGLPGGRRLSRTVWPLLFCFFCWLACTRPRRFTRLPPAHPATHPSSLPFPPQVAAEIDARSLYASPFPHTASLDALSDFFRQHGGVRCVRMRRHVTSKDFKGSVFVELDSAEEAQRVRGRACGGDTPGALVSRGLAGRQAGTCATRQMQARCAAQLPQPARVCMLVDACPACPTCRCWAWS